MTATRGCGDRVANGIYFETIRSPRGKSVEHFLIDPPIVVDDWDLSPIGVELIERDGVYHIVDWVGSQHYPNVADFVEEVRRFGLSRRLSKRLDFSKITPSTQILLVHSKAWIDNYQDYVNSVNDGDYWECPKQIQAHAYTSLASQNYQLKEMCAGLWWQDVEQAKQSLSPLDPRRVERTMPSFSYEALKRPNGVEPKYKLALFASFPCSRLAVVRGASSQVSMSLASKAQVAVEEVES